MTTTLFLSALAMGFLGSPHCLGMCGGIVTAFGLSMSDGNKKLLTLVYHLGRLTSYALLGGLAGMIGLAVLAPFLNADSARILLASSLVLAGAIMLGLPILNQLEKIGLKFWQTLAPLRRRLFPLNTVPRAFGAGLLWGFLPCGLVYGALGVAVSIGASSQHSAINVANSALFMLIFGLGTIPMLVATQSVIAFINERIARFSVRKMSGAFLIVFGLFVFAMPLLHNHDHAHSHGHTDNHTDGHADSHIGSHAQATDSHAHPASDATNGHSEHAHSAHQH